MISWTIKGVETILDDRDTSILLASDGLGMPAFHRLEERGPLQHGASDRGYRLDPRIITLILGIHGESSSDFYEKRYKLLDVFKPTDTAGILKWSKNGVVRCIRGYLIEGLSYMGADQEYLYQKAPVVIKCPDPTWYDPSGKAFDFTIGGGSDVMEVPLTIPMKVGASSISTTQAIDYKGSVLTYPIITITGPITNCVISNETTGDKLDFTGYTIPSGTTYTIDLRYGYKTVRDGSGTNHISKLSDDSDLATWCLQPDPIVLGGSNSIRVTGTNVTQDTKINLQYYERFIGL